MAASDLERRVMLREYQLYREILRENGRIYPPLTPIELDVLTDISLSSLVRRLRYLCTTPLVTAN
jgi:hypothetical protein